MLIALWWLVLLGVPLLVALAVRGRVQERRRRRGGPAMTLTEELRPLLAPPVAWGAFLALGTLVARYRCDAELPYVDLAEGVTADEYCDAQVRDQLPGTVVAVSLLVALLAVLWVVLVLVLRAREQRRTLVG